MIAKRVNNWMDRTVEQDQDPHTSLLQIHVPILKRTFVGYEIDVDCWLVRSIVAASAGSSSGEGVLK